MNSTAVYKKHISNRIVCLVMSSLKVKGWRVIDKKTQIRRQRHGVAKLTSNKADFTASRCTRNEEVRYVMMKGQFIKSRTTMLNVFVPKTASK